MSEKLNTYEPNENYTEQDWEVFSKWIRNILTLQDVSVTFTKKDGTERVMNCTLREDVLPAVTIDESKEPRKKSNATVSVYDLDAKSWRSFTTNAVKRVSFAMDDS
jgi:hypothetical protein